MWFQGIYGRWCLTLLLRNNLLVVKVTEGQVFLFNSFFNICFCYIYKNTSCLLSFSFHFLVNGIGSIIFDQFIFACFWLVWKFLSYYVGKVSFFMIWILCPPSVCWWVWTNLVIVKNIVWELRITLLVLSLVRREWIDKVSFFIYCCKFFSFGSFVLIRWMILVILG